MTQDLSLAAKPVSDLFHSDLAKNTSSFSISEDQLHFFKTQGYLPDIKVLSDFQVDKLLEELADLSNPKSPGNELFHEYHSNESTDPNKNDLSTQRISGFSTLKILKERKTVGRQKK